MTTPTPPPGYKLVKGIDIKDRLPIDGIKYWYEHKEDWRPSVYSQNSTMSEAYIKNIYAIPSSPNSITDEAKTAVDDPYQIHIGGVKCDPYRIARAYSINDPVIFQALKKLLRCGRKHKDRATDVREAITSLERWEQMNQEDSK